MEKDFDRWNEKKKNLDVKEERLFFREGEIWWTNLGLNIGFEMNGKGDEYTRPAIILKKYNQYSFLALPLSTSKVASKYKVAIGAVGGKEAVANLSQIRNVDSKRLVRKIGHIEQEMLANLKKKASQVNLD